jgi:uncharacterized membrane protein
MSGGFFAGGVMLWRFRTLIKKFAWTTGAVFTILAISVLVAFGRIQPVNWKSKDIIKRLLFAAASFLRIVNTDLQHYPKVMMVEVSRVCA